MNKLQTITIAFTVLSLFSCNSSDDKQEDTHIQEAILADNNFKDSNFVLTDFKQGAFNINYYHDTLGVLYNSWILIFRSIPKIVTADTSGWTNPYEYCGKWKTDNIAGYPIVTLKNNYFKKIFLNLKKGDSHNFDWREIHKDHINGFISFSDTFSYVSDSKLIALNLYTEGKYSYSIYSIPNKPESRPERLLTSCYTLLSLNPELENNKIKNIKPEAYTIGCNK
jgi:hypothetical protein